MSEIARALKTEITRLARKELKTGSEVLRKSSAQYRRDIAELKRQVVALGKQVAYLERQDRARTRDVPADAASAGTRFSSRGLASHRERLGLSAADYGRLVGVSGQTIYNWERGDSRPRAAQLAAVVAVRGLGKRDALRRLELE